MTTTTWGSSKRVPCCRAECPVGLGVDPFALLVASPTPHCRSPWRGRQFIRWEEVAQVIYSTSRAGSSFTRRTTNSHPGIRLGVDEFHGRMRATPVPASTGRGPRAYLRVGREFPEGISLGVSRVPCRGRGRS